jgi:hypothetical protein
MQIKLRNLTGGTTKIGDLCRINPKNPSSVINVTDLSSLPVLGTYAQSAPNGNPVLIDLLNSPTMPMQGQVIISPTAPPSPTIGTIWIEASIT